MGKGFWGSSGGTGGPRRVLGVPRIVGMESWGSLKCGKEDSGGFQRVLGVPRRVGMQSWESLKGGNGELGVSRE